MKGIRSIIENPRIQWLFIALCFFAVSWIHMGPSLTHLNSVVLSKPGDHTAGIMYVSWVHPSSPILGHSGLTNYPYGEDLWQPLSASAILPLTAHLVLSKLTNIVCAWNLLVLFGYMSTALAMFGFIRWLTRRAGVAFLAAYAVTFTPYHLFASWGQIAGLLGAVFILALWQFVDFWYTPTKVKAARLGALLGLSFYVDGYFILVGLVMLVALWISSLGYIALYRQKLAVYRPRLVGLCLASVVTVVSLLPLLWVKHRYAAQIDSFLGNVRGDAAADAQTYSAQLPLYFKPDSLLFIGWSVAALALVALVFAALEYRKRRKGHEDSSSHLFVVYATTIVAMLSLWVSLRPKGAFLGLTIYNPSHFIIMLTSSWRVFGRLYVLVAIGFATLAALGLAYLLKRYPRRRRLIVGVSMALIVVELGIAAPSAPAPNFDYREAPSVYSWLKDNPVIRGVAEYPLDEPPQGAYLSDYYTFQQISGKPILNTMLPSSGQSDLRRSIIGINDPQTLPVLRALGIDVVNIRPVSVGDQELDIGRAAEENAGLKRIFAHKDHRWNIRSYVINPGATASYALTISDIQYFQISQTKDGVARYAVGDNTQLKAVPMPNAKPRERINISFILEADVERKAAIIQDGELLWSGNLGTKPETIQLTMSPDKPIVIYNQIFPQILTRLTISDLRVINE